MKLVSKIIIPILFLLLLSCGTNKEDRGKKLAETYCNSCHLAPDPSILDKNTWEKSVLPEMASRMGQVDNFEKLASIPFEELNDKISHNVYSSKPYMSAEDWELLKNYIISHAPSKIPAQKNKIPIDTNQSTLFKTIINPSSLDTFGNTTGLFLENNQTGFVLASESGNYSRYDAKGKRISTIKSPLPIVQTLKNNNETYALAIGRMNPNDSKLGKLYKIVKNTFIPISAIDSLRRPVSFQMADLNQDKTNDFIICEFGFEIGQLAWFDGKTFEKHILKADPGARNLIIKDFNQDGKLDILALMTQAKEGIYLFTNKGNGNFEEKALLQFHPAFGSSFFELIDFNHDGKEDIILSNGDNGDYSYTKKNFHGIHYFENLGNLSFKEKFFLPVYGETKAIVRDFDKDGDYDIASTSYYFEKSEKQNERFLYFENKGHNSFSCSNFNLPKSGQYIAIEAGDIDLDGDLDIVLGSYKIQKAIQEGEIKGHQFTLLINQLKN